MGYFFELKKEKEMSLPNGMSRADGNCGECEIALNFQLTQGQSFSKKDLEDCITCNHEQRPKRYAESLKGGLVEGTLIALDSEAKVRQQQIEQNAVFLQQRMQLI